MQKSNSCVTLPDLLGRSAELDRSAVVLLEPGHRLGARELQRRAAIVATRFAHRGICRGEPIAICVADTESFLPLFWGALLAGAVPAPLPQPVLARGSDSEAMRRIVAVARHLGTSLVCGGHAELAALRERLGANVRLFDAAPLLANLALESGGEPGCCTPDLRADDLAILQFSSGSTGAPKGVELTHRNVLANLEAMREVQRMAAGDRMLSWLPYFHDFGLFACHLSALYAGCDELRLEPATLAKRPGAWLDAVELQRATVSYCTPSALRLLTHELERRSRAQRPLGDLSSLRLLVIGAEMIPRPVSQAFASAALHARLSPTTLRFGYGLAENTLMATLSEHARFSALDRVALEAGRVQAQGSPHADMSAEDGGQGAAFARLGRPLPGVTLAVRTDAGVTSEPDVLGSVVIRGESTSRGYHRDPDATAAIRGDGWLDTGDRGFLDANGELVLVGRDKDVLIQHGRNIHLHDVAQVALEAGSGALRDCIACADYDERAGRERLFLFCIATPARDPATENGSWVERVQRAIQQVFEVDVAACVRLRPADVPRTSSGKIQRAQLVRRHREEGLGERVDRQTPGPVDAVEPALRAQVESIWREAFALDPSESLEGADFFGLGGDSLRALRVQSALESIAGRKLPPWFCHRERTIEAQTQCLARSLADAPGARDDLEQLIAEVVAWELGRRAGDVARDDRLIDLAPDMACASRMYSELARVLQMPRAELERAPTVAALATLARPKVLAPLAPGARFELMQFQETLYFHRQGYVAREPSGLSCYIVYRVELSPAMEPRRLDRSIADLVARHPMLRAAIDEAADRPQLYVTEARVQPAELWDLRDLDPDAQRLRLEALDRELQDRRCDLTRAPLLHARLVRLGDDRCQLSLHIDHMVIDGYGFLQLVIELLQRYVALRDPACPPDPPVEYQFDAYVRLEHLRRRTSGYEARMAGHLELFRDLPPRFALPMRDDPARLEAVHFETHRTRMPAATIRSLEQIAAGDPAVSLNALLLAAYFKVMNLWSGESDLIVNVPIFNREQYMPGVEQVAGSFIDIVPVRLRTQPSMGLLEMARGLEAFLRALLETPVSSIDLARRIAARDQRVGSISSVIFSNSIHLIDPRALRFDGLEILGVPEVHTGAPGTYLDLVLFNVAEDYCFDWNYVRELFDPAFIATLASQYEQVLQQLVQHGARDARFDVSAVLPPEWCETLTRINDTATPFDARPIQLQIADAALRNPSAIALTFEDHALDYGELLARSRELGGELVAGGVRPGDFVALVLGRSIDFVVAQLGVLWAGAAYVPVDPHYPANRVHYLIEDSGAPVVITHARHRERLELERLAGRSLLVLDAADTRVRASAHALPPPSDAEDPMYMIYTSGSTGAPKGVVVSHRSFANFIQHVLREFVRGPTEQFAFVTSPSFDMTLASNWAPLSCGATLHILDEENTANVAGLLEFLERRRITLLNVTPSHFALLAQALPLLSDRPQLSPMMRVLLGGESIDTHALNAWLEHFPHHEFVNEYGPTEATVATHFLPIPKNVRGQFELAPVPIGWPIANSRAYILSEDGEPCMPGVPGYLYLAGTCVAKGYWNKPDKTASAFVLDPHDPPNRMYFTGDRARFLPDGQIVFLGRCDGQVNLRGYRIELGEIEAALRSLPEVQDAAVELAHDAGGFEVLIAFYVPARRGAEESALRAALARELPEHMLPTRCVAIDALPLTPSGKLDRAALRARARSLPNHRRASRSRAPESTLEARIHALWADVLGTDEFGVEEDFWALGGDSLRIMRLVQRLRSELGFVVGLADVFEHRSVATQAERFALHMRAAEPPPSARFVPLRRVASARYRAVLLPPAAGTAATYTGLEAALPGAEVLAARYPGHEIDGTPLASIEAIAEWLERDLPEDGIPMLFAGVSFGAYVAYELARRALLRGPRVCGLVLGAATPPGARDRIMQLAQLPAAEFRSVLPSLLPTDQLRLSDAELDRYGMLLQVDTRAMLEHTFQPLPAAGHLPVLLVVGEAEDDPIIALEQSRWLPYLGEAELVRVPGPHLFVRHAGEAFTRRLRELGERR